MTIYTELSNYFATAENTSFYNALDLEPLDEYITPEYLSTVSISTYSEPKRHPEICKAISEALKNNPNARCYDQSGEKNHFYGKKHTEESKALLKKARVGRKPALGKTWKRSEEGNRRLSEACKGRKKHVLPNGKWTWIYPKT